ncbi:MAG: peptidoglycan-associated lipoprotein Pal [Rickettsiales bacterium]|jgi:peptidoglycan-associated lipoprotein|nr:peptidoglycan-associated lipoprotein Pal [Rickettsiales bacterium]
MKNLAKSLLMLGVAVSLSACSSDEAAPTAEAPAVGEAAPAVGEVALAAEVKGVVAGSQADLDKRAGNIVHFSYDKYNLSADAAKTLKKQALWLKAYPNVNIIVEGHCDERGTRKYNQALGERRADAAKRYLIANGVSAKRITTVSYGKDRPIATGNTEAAYAQNRRDVTVLAK